MIGAGGCPPFIQSELTSCRLFWDEVLKSVDLGAFGNVVIAGQWPLYFDHLSPDARVSQANMFSLELSKLLGDFDGEVIFISTPPLGARPRSCFERLGLITSRDCNIDFDVAVGRSQSEASLVASVRQIDNITIFDPYKYLCNKIECLVLNDDKILYLDDSHFSIEGALWLVPALSEILMVDKG